MVVSCANYEEGINTFLFLQKYQLVLKKVEEERVVVLGGSFRNCVLFILETTQVLQVF
jgi:hypothetical protein